MLVPDRPTPSNQKKKRADRFIEASTIPRGVVISYLACPPFNSQRLVLVLFFWQPLSNFHFIPSNGSYTLSLLPHKSSRMAAAANCFKHGTVPVSANLQHRQQPPRSNCVVNMGGDRNMMLMGGHGKASKRSGMITCVGREIGDFIGGDLVRFDLGQWLSDVEEHKALAVYSPHEGGYEGRYLNRLTYQGYYFLDLSARGLGDPETTLTKVHPVCPAHLGKQPIARWYFPPEVDYRLAALPPKAKGLVVWIIEAKVLSKAELQFLALLPTLRPKVRVIAECGNWRRFVWKPLKEISGLTANEE